MLQQKFIQPVIISTLLCCIMAVSSAVIASSSSIATAPNPANGATNVDLNVLFSWTAADCNVISHNIYLGTTSPGTLVNKQPVAIFYAGKALMPETTYYWRVDEVNETATSTGELWSFTTAPASGQCQPSTLCADAGTAIMKAILPVSRPTESWWLERHEAKLAEIAAANSVDMIFIGDSITHAWEDSGAAVWQQYYAPRNAINLGFSGDMTQNVLWRLNHGELDGISPELAIIMIGTNNTFPPPTDDYTAEDIAVGIKSICCTVRQHLPNTKILLLAIFPRGQYPSEERIKSATASVLASQVADGRTIFYMDIGSCFLDSAGTLSATIFFDYIHPNATGYTIWANEIEPMVQKLLSQ